mmetsp:Transcript_43603/g.109466  ORF Transcript_43603/g.109466 Transcript_43603/m.109466 type:complete len:544 (+) Transcript_43603:101-1732(+)
MQGAEYMQSASNAAAAAANAAAPGAAPMKVEIGPGRRDADTPSGGKRSPGSRRNKGGNAGPQQPSFGMAPGGIPGMDPAAMSQAMAMNMQMMYNPAMAQAFMSMPAMNPFAVPPMFGGMPGNMPMYNPMGGGMPSPSSPMGFGGCGMGGGKGGGKGAKGDGKGRGKTRRGNKPKGAQDRAGSPGSAGDDDPDRSAALRQVRKEGAKSKIPLGEVLPHVLEFARDSHGSRFLQSTLDAAEKDDKQLIFSGIQGNFIALANDAHGNFVVQKFFDIGSVDQKKEIVTELYPKLLVLANETHGCRVVQKAIQHVPRESQLVMATKLKENVVACIESMHGNHVIQKCIEQMPPDSVTFIIEAVEAEAQRMASHMYGCRVAQRLLEHCASHQLETMLNKILTVIDKLATDNYGNYVVQHMLEHGRVEDKKIIIGVIERNIVEFSKHKCSSNVVEKALEIATVGEHAAQLENERSSLMFRVIGDPQDPNPPLRQMMEDRFGNFIVQRMIEHARGPERERLRQQLQASQDQLKNSSHGKHILNALRKENMA